MTICPPSHADIDQVPCGYCFCSLTVTMDTSGVGTGTAGLPSGSIPPLCPEAAAKAKTTSTAPGEDLLNY